MVKSRKTLFISDIHLSENEPEINQQFYQLINHVDQQLDAIYILGDLFDAWVGDDEDTPLHRQVISTLKNATQRGLPIYFIWGNRDFLISKKFLKATGCQKLKDEEIIQLYGTPVLLMHGDTLCTYDKDYLRLRKMFRNPLIQRLFLSMPLRFRQRFKEKARMQSQEATYQKPMYMIDAVADTVEKKMNKHQVSYLVHGHTHLPGIHLFDLDKKPATRFVLGAWHDGPNGLIWYEDGQKKLIKW